MSLPLDYYQPHPPLPFPVKKNRFLKSPTHWFWGFYRVLGFIGLFGLFLFEAAIGKLVVYFRSSAKVLFRFVST